MPTSRGGKDCPENKSLHHAQKDHEAYHVIFSNMVPEEIGPFLAKYWWNDSCIVTVTLISNGHGTVCGSNLARKKTSHTQKEISAYQQLFFGASPAKIMDCLARNWWNNKYSVELFDNYKKYPAKYRQNSISLSSASRIIAA